MKKTFFLASLFTAATLAPARAQSTFPDVPNDHWAARAVKKLAEAGIIEGRPSAAAPASTRSTQVSLQTTGKNSVLGNEREAVIEAIEADGRFENAVIHVAAFITPKEGRLLTLEGAVDNSSLRDLASAIAEPLVPNFKVSNSLKVTPGIAEEVRLTRTIRKAFRDKGIIKLSPFNAGVEVSRKTKTVTLYTAPTTQANKVAMTRIAAEIARGYKIINDTTVIAAARTNRSPRVLATHR